ncbi:MAG: hypothetical protein RMY64_19425 [Nostoc sp. DedQUE08]|nr:hypothetical protein [Nostoc sp. DedQUE08]
MTNDQYLETFKFDTSVTFSKKTIKATVELDLVASLFLANDQ